MKAVYLEWWDTTKELDWSEAKNIDIELKIPTKTLGWFVKENERGLVIAVSYDEETKACSCFKTIPKCAIKKRKYIKL